MHPKFACLVRSGRNHAALMALAANHDSFAFQRRVREVFHRDEEGVHIDVEDGAGESRGVGGCGHAEGILAVTAGPRSVHSALVKTKSYLDCHLYRDGLAILLRRLEL